MMPRSSTVCEITASNVSSTSGAISARRDSRASASACSAAISGALADTASARSSISRRSRRSSLRATNSVASSSRSSASGLSRKTPNARCNHLSGKCVISQRTRSRSYAGSREVRLVYRIVPPQADDGQQQSNDSEDAQHPVMLQHAQHLLPSDAVCAISRVTALRRHTLFTIIALLTALSPQR